MSPQCDCCECTLLLANGAAKTNNVTGNEGYTFDNANRIATRQVAAAPVSNYTSDANGNTFRKGSEVAARYNTCGRNRRHATNHRADR